MDDLLNIALSNAVAAAVLAVAAVAVGAVCRRPALVHGLWLLVLVKLVTPPLVRVPVCWTADPEPVVSETQGALPAPAAERLVPLPAAPVDVIVLPAMPAPEVPGAAEEVPVEAVPAPSAVATPFRDITDPSLWTGVLPVLWLTGSTGWFALAGLRLRRFRRLLRHARPAPAVLQERTRRLARRLGLTFTPTVHLLPGRLAPMLWAVGGRPRLLVPANLLDHLSAEGRDTLLVHELAHLRRRDHWVRGLEFVVMGLYWWHPVVWYARRELRETEEQCCDAWVVSTLPGAGRAYAAALLDTLDFLSAPGAAVPPLASGVGQVSDLKRRLTMIMRGTTPRALSWPGCLVVLAVAALFLPLLPALHAQPPAKDQKKDLARPDTLEVRQAQAELEAAAARLKEAEAQLRMQEAMIAQAKAKLAAAAKQADAAKQAAADKVRQLRDIAAKEEYLRALKEAKAQAEKGLPSKDGKKPQIRIEIIISGRSEGKGVDVKEVVRKLHQALPDIQHKITIQAGSDWPMQKPPVNLKVMPYAPNPPLGSSVAPYFPKAARPVGPISVYPPAGPPDKRIRELEQKLEKVLQELQELRKEMKKQKGANRDPNKATNTFYYDKLSK